MSALDTAGVAFPLRYVLYSGRPPLDLELTVEADANCVLDVRTGWSLPQSAPLRLGRFAGRLDPEPFAALVSAAAAAAAASSRAPSTDPYESATRLIGAGGGPLTPVDDEDPGAGSFEQWLRTGATALLATPLAAVDVSAEPVGDSGAAELVITAVGTTAQPILLVEPGTNEWIRLWSDGPQGPQYLEYEDIERLVAAGSLPPGVVELAPGTSLRLPLPGSAAETRRTGGFHFWWVGPGLARGGLQGDWSL
ncbi:hypothetical protein ACFPJ1_25190 [Kribbella qitaiheensis]|uniref:hypothetical protein n=1 Tax=Kribbella qitaiheensis TaxID=1544730 RepID=UPI0036077F52